MKWIIALVWLALGTVGFAGQNALYQFSDSGDCWAREYEWRHRRHELQDMFDALLGPVNLVFSFIYTGGFSYGFSFHYGTPARCLWVGGPR